MLADRIAHILFNLALALTQLLLVFALCLVFGVLELMVVTRRIGTFTLPVPAETHLDIVFKAFFGLL